MPSCHFLTKSLVNCVLALSSAARAFMIFARVRAAMRSFSDAALFSASTSSPACFLTAALVASRLRRFLVSISLFDCSILAARDVSSWTDLLAFLDASASSRFIVASTSARPFPWRLSLRLMPATSSAFSFLAAAILA